MIYFVVLGYLFDEFADRPIEKTFVRDRALAMEIFEDDSTVLDAVALYELKAGDDIGTQVPPSTAPRLIRQFGSLPSSAHPLTLDDLMALCGADRVS